MRYFLIDGLSLSMAALVAVVALIIVSFSRRYMDGNSHEGRFYAVLAAVIACVGLLIFANHLVIFAAAWLGMGIALAALIGHVGNWPSARASARIALYHFLAGTAALAAGLALLGWQSQSLTITGITDYFAQDAAGKDPGPFVLAGTCLLVLAGIIQSALFPFHSWLLASMTAPTPVSALMHAGLVNAGGFLVVRFAPLFSTMPDMMTVMFALGAVSAFLASFWMLGQSDIKRALGCSTVAQMGFMIMQCGLGFYTAAIAHLILHGFFKAYHFLAAGSAVDHPRLPSGAVEKAGTYHKRVLSILMMIAGGVVAGGAFALLTGKTIQMLDSGTILIAFAAFAGMQAARGFAGMSHMAAVTRSVTAIAVIAALAALYAGLYMGLGVAIPVNDPQQLNSVHIATILIFATAWLAMTAGLHRRSTRLYMASLNQARAPISTSMCKRSSYHAG